MISFIISFLLIKAQAAPPLSKGEFLSGVSNGSVTMDGRQPYFKNNLAFVKTQIDRLKKTFPEFNDQMYGYYYKSKGQHMYSVAYNWTSQECWFEITKVSAEGSFESQHKDNERSVVPISICEKLYGFKHVKR